MKENSIETIELEMAILYRLMTSLSNKNGNLDRSAYLLLHQLSSHGCASVKTLAEEFQLDISTVSRQASSLEKKGYLYKTPNPEDGRSYALEITDLGKKEFNQYRRVRIKKINELLEDWPEEERNMFGHLLRKYNHLFY